MKCMKKYHLYLWFIALVGLITSCSRDEAAGPQNEASNRVRIGASIDQALQTRAASVTIPANHKLRYVLEVWSTGTESACIYRLEKTTKGAEAVEFDFILSEAKNYKALLWADFVPGSETGTPVTTPNAYTHYADHYYVTNSADGLKAVALVKTGADYVINDDARDAFFSCLPFEKGTGAFAKSVELKRPFGQINVIEKNTALRDNVASMTLTYKVPQTFSVETGATTGTVEVNPTVNTLPTADGDRKANLFYDYIFTPAEGQTTLGEIKLTFTDNDPATNLNDFTIPANMPVKRNKRTNISGSILHTSTVPSTSAKLSVTVSDGWTGEAENEEIPQLVWDGTTTSQPAGYDANSPGEVEITSAPELAWLARQSNTFENYTFRLTADIDLNHHEWKPIGTSSSNFKGTFYGQHHTVSNMKCTTTPEAGLFGDLSGATVQDVTVSGSVSFAATSENGYLGGIAGYVTSSTITGCTNQCTVSATGDEKYCYVGGIVGRVNSAEGGTSTLSGNTNTGNVSANGHTSSRAGGIIGYAFSSSANSSITLTGNTYDDGTPAGVCIGMCSILDGGTITINGTGATSGKPYPDPQQP